MQVPSANTATMTTGAEHAPASATPGAFGDVAGAHSGRKAQLPEFVAIFTEQSVHASAGTNAGNLMGAAENVTVQDETVLSGITHAELRTPTGLLSDPVRPGGREHDHALSGVRGSKNDAMAERHKTAGDSPTRASGEKLSSPGADAATASTIAAPMGLVVAQMVPGISSENSRSPFPDMSLQSRQDVFPHSSSMPRSLKEESVQRAASVSSEVIPERPPQAVESFKHDLQPQEAASTKLQSVSLPLIPEPTESTVPVPENMLRGHREGHEANNLSVSNPAEEKNNAAVPFTGLQARETISQATVASLYKPKTQEKTTVDAARSVAAPISALGASSVDGMQSHGTVLAMTPVARMVDLASSDSKHGPAISAMDTFQRLDSGGTPGALLHSSAHQIVVGVHDPLLGWLQVQTQSSTGHINATITAGSTEAHASLVAQAPAIVQYLADRNVSVHSLDVHSQADKQGSAPGGHSQSGTGNTHQETQEQRGLGVEGIGVSSFSETSSGNMPTLDTASYISIRA